MKRIVVCLLLLFVADSGFGEFIKASWTYAELYEMADMVVIGRAQKTKETAEKSWMILDGNVLELDGRAAPGERRYFDYRNGIKTSRLLSPDSRGWEVVGQSTEFLVSFVMKGDKHTHDFVLHHYRYAKISVPIDAKPPLLLSFREDPKNLVKFLPDYLLFLKKEADGRYAPLKRELTPPTPAVWRLDQASEEKP